MVGRSGLMSEAIASAIMAPDRPPLEPRCIPIAEAAAYCGLTPSGFRHWVAIGRLPGALPGHVDGIGGR